MVAATSGELELEIRGLLNLFMTLDKSNTDELDCLLSRLSVLPHSAERDCLANDILDLRAAIVGST